MSQCPYSSIRDYCLFNLPDLEKENFNKISWSTLILSRQLYTTFDRRNCDLYYCYHFQGCFKQSLSVVTLYTNLGEDAVRHGLLETGVDTVITSSELLPKFVRILSGQDDKVTKIIYFENPIRKTRTQAEWWTELFGTFLNDLRIYFRGWGWFCDYFCSICTISHFTVLCVASWFWVGCLIWDQVLM